MASRAFRNSLFLAVSAATITMAVGALVSYMSVRAKIKGAKTLDFVGTIPYAVPCTMVAIAMILAWSRPPCDALRHDMGHTCGLPSAVHAIFDSHYQRDSSAGACFA